MSSFPRKHYSVTALANCYCDVRDLCSSWCRMNNHAFQHVCGNNNRFAHTPAHSNDLFLHGKNQKKYLNCLSHQNTSNRFWLIYTPCKYASTYTPRKLVFVCISSETFNSFRHMTLPRVIQVFVYIHKGTLANTNIVGVLMLYRYLQGYMCKKKKDL